jgi:hypothetical protein
MIVKDYKLRNFKEEKYASLNRAGGAMTKKGFLG